MIAERQSNVQVTESVGIDLFAGLSFPNVPTKSVVLQNKVEPEENNQKVNHVENEELLEEENTDDVDSGESSRLIGTIDDQPKKKLGNLSTLYATEVVVSGLSSYPELPSLGQQSPISRRETMSDQYVEDRYTEAITEHSSLLSNTSSSVSAPPVSASAGEDPSLLSDLLRENTRLSDELTNLKEILQIQQQNGDSDEAVSYTASAVHERQQQQKAAALRTASHSGSASTSAATGVMITDTSMPPKQGVKYVCCGGCRQWLLAPKDAVYVACVSCQAVNNCNLAPNKQQRATADAETRALQQSSQSQQSRLPWFLDCFGGASS